MWRGVALRGVSVRVNQYFGGVPVAFFCACYLHVGLFCGVFWQFKGSAVLLHIMHAPSHVLVVLLGSAFGVLALGCFQVFLFEFLRCFLLSYRDRVGRKSFPLDV